MRISYKHRLLRRLLRIQKEVVADGWVCSIVTIMCLMLVEMALITTFPFPLSFLDGTSDTTIIGGK